MQFTFASNIFEVRLDCFDFVENSARGHAGSPDGTPPRQDRRCHIDLVAGPRRGCGGMADAADSKSASRKGVGVQVPSPAPIPTEQADMAKSAVMTVRLTPEVSEKLEALARDTKRSKSYLASEAIESYVDL